MNNDILRTAVLFCCCCNPVSAQGTDNATLERGLKHVREAGESWMNKLGCVSCHQVPSMIWAFEAAKGAGVEVPHDKLQAWEDWSTDVVNFVKPPQKADCDREATMASNIDTLTALLLAIPHKSNAEWRKDFATMLVSEQSEDGSWKPCGQLPGQRRPEPETRAATTLWTTLALAREDVTFNRETALQFADSVSKPESTEWYAARLLVADQLGEDGIGKLQTSLLEQQNDDGGWGWLVDEPSDAFGTALALYALARTGCDSESLSSARAYLVTAQSPSGKWLVPGTKKSAKGKPTATSSDWGSAWAIIALAESE